MENLKKKYEETNRNSKKKYNSDKTFVQISKPTHEKLKKYGIESKIKVIDFLEKLISDNIN